MITLQESLLDDFESIERKSSEELILKDIHDKHLNAPGTSGKDALNKPLKVGDLVIAI